MPRIINLDNSNENADWIKKISASRGNIDIPGVNNIFQLLSRAGINTSGPDSSEQIVKFYNEHKWIADLNTEARLVVDQAIRNVHLSKMESESDEPKEG